MHRRVPTPVALAVVALLVALVTTPSRSSAGTPSSGTLSTAQPALAYTAGPFVVPVEDPLVCDVVDAPCDRFALTVDTAAGFEATNNVKVVVSWENRAADFDLYILDAAGRTLTSSSSSQDPEAALFAAKAGSYTLLVVPFNPLGQTFSGTITFSPKQAGGTSLAAQRYRSYPAPINARTSRAGEPSIASNWQSGAILFQSSFFTFLVTDFDPASSTSTWTDRSPALVPNTDSRCVQELSLDPIGFGDPITGRYFNSQLLTDPVINSETCFTDDDGLTWLQSQGGGFGQSVDHQTVGGGPYKPGIKDALGNTVGPKTSYPHAVYYCSQDVAFANCARSDDGGLTFGVSVPIYTILSGCSGLHGHVKVAPNGTVYVPNKGCGGGQGVIVSLDNGQTWTPRFVPGTVQSKSDPSVGIGRDGTLYFGYANGDGRPRIAVSRDEGITWTDDADVGAAIGLNNVVFPAVVAGDGDRAAFAFLGTTTAGNLEAEDFQGIWQTYVAHSYDRGKTWITTTIDMPNDPVQVGCIWLSGGSNPCRNLLDFMDATVDAQGLVHVGIPDGCILQCSSDPQVKTDTANGYRTRLATVVRQTGGLRLFRESDPDLVVSDIRMGISKSQTAVLVATVTNNGASGADSFTVRFSDGTRSVDATVAGVAAGSSVKVSVLWSSQLKNGTYTITTTADATKVIPETNESNNSLTRTFTVSGNKVTSQ
ncbi:MAG TPA: CARDB domain-containing protein [Candidatus Limnocylindria bacterium]|nr:CARDB domain-containing protein [Candidatus Limnocylindria bacterium]